MIDYFRYANGGDNIYANEGADETPAAPIDDGSYDMPSGFEGNALLTCVNRQRDHPTSLAPCDLDTAPC